MNPPFGKCWGWQRIFFFCLIWIHLTSIRNFLKNFNKLGVPNYADCRILTSQTLIPPLDCLHARNARTQNMYTYTYTYTYVLLYLLLSSRTCGSCEAFSQTHGGKAYTETEPTFSHLNLNRMHASIAQTYPKSRIFDKKY